MSTKEKIYSLIDGFTEEQLADNFNTLMDAIVKAKPASAKGTYMKSVTVASTMGPGIKVNTLKIG